MTSAFRDMLFFNRWGLAHPNLYLNTVVVFLAVGLWHAVNPYWILWGLIHGLGFCAFILWRKWRGPGAQPLPWVVGWGQIVEAAHAAGKLPNERWKLYMSQSITFILDVVEPSPASSLVLSAADRSSFAAMFS